MGSFGTAGGGITKLSQLLIDLDKDWAGKNITNFGSGRVDLYSLLTAHASRHASGGADALSSGSISGDMLKCVLYVLADRTSGNAVNVYNNSIYLSPLDRLCAYVSGTGKCFIGNAWEVSMSSLKIRGVYGPSNEANIYDLDLTGTYATPNATVGDYNKHEICAWDFGSVATRYIYAHIYNWLGTSPGASIDYSTDDTSYTSFLSVGAHGEAEKFGSATFRYLRWMGSWYNDTNATRLYALGVVTPNFDAGSIGTFTVSSEYTGRVLVLRENTATANYLVWIERRVR